MKGFNIFIAIIALATFSFAITEQIAEMRERGRRIEYTTPGMLAQGYMIPDCSLGNQLVMVQIKLGQDPVTTAVMCAYYVSNL